METFSAGLASSYAACSAVALLRSTLLYSRIWSAHRSPTWKAAELISTEWMKMPTALPPTSRTPRSPEDFFMVGYTRRGS